MDAKTVVRKIAKITRTVLKLLESSNKDAKEIRESASKELGMDLSGRSRRTFVSSLVKLFHVELQAKEEAEAEAEAEEEEAEEKAEKRPKKEDRLICEFPASNRKVTVTDYQRKRMISIREYCKENGKEKPLEKGIHLTIDQWARLKENFPAIDDAIKKMQSRLN